MKPPVLHMVGPNQQNRCGEDQENTNWPEKYLNDELARTLKFCEICKAEFIQVHGQDKMNTILTTMRADTMQTTDDNWAEDHPDEVLNHVTVETPTNVGLKTLRMYLEVGA